MIGIVQGLPFHYEMIGHAVEYCQERGLDWIVFANDTPEGDLWKPFYAKRKITWRPLSPALDQCQVIIVLTDYDWALDEETRARLSKRMILLDHRRLHYKSPEALHVGVRPYPSAPDQPWVLPVYKAVRQEERPERIGIRCVMIGNSYVKTREELAKRITNLDEIDIIIIARTISKEYRFQGLTYLENIAADQMVDVLKATDYVYCMNTDPAYVDGILSGALALGLSCGCQIVLHKDWQKHYQLASALVYKQAITLGKPNTSAVYADLERLIQHRNRVYDHALGQIKPS